MLHLEGGAAPYGRYHTRRASFQFLQVPNIISASSLSSCKCMTSHFSFDRESIFYHFRLMYFKSWSAKHTQPWPWAQGRTIYNYVCGWCEGKRSDRHQSKHTLTIYPANGAAAQIIPYPVCVFIHYNQIEVRILIAIWDRKLDILILSQMKQQPK